MVTSSENREFVLDFSTEDMDKEILFCGTHSGKEVDKFKETNLPALPAKHVKPPLIGNCVVNMECKVVGQLNTGAHTIFAGKIVTAYISEESKRRIYSLGGREFRGFRYI